MGLQVSWRTSHPRQHRRHLITECRYNYERPTGVRTCRLDAESDIYLYPCVEPEDQRLSPYVAMWLLAWGASMNIQKVRLHLIRCRPTRHRPPPRHCRRR
jgi:hypothetical protein